jgi:hypothetical protein
VGFLVLAVVLLATRPLSPPQPGAEVPRTEADERIATAATPQPQATASRSGSSATITPSEPRPVTLPPAPAPRPVAILTTYEERRRVQERVRQADAADHEDGNVAMARSVYEYAVGKGWAPAALALAFTHDPHELQRRGVTVRADPGKARACYLKARELMDATVAFYLSRLAQSTADKC